MSNLLASPSKKAQFKFSKERFQYRSLYKQEMPIEDDYDPNANQKVALSKEDYFIQQREENNSIDLRDVLLSKGVDFNDPTQHIKWLPLQKHDDVGFEQVFVDDRIDFEGVMFDDKPFTVTAKIVVCNDNNVEFERGEVLGYDDEKKKFKCVIPSCGRRLVPRIYVCFDHENHYKWAERFALAWFSRIVAHSILKKGAFIACMPRDHLPDMPNEQKKNIEQLIRKNKKLEFSEISALMMDAAIDYQLIMNRILFDHHLSANPTDLVPHGLVLPEPEPPKEPDYFGMLALEAKKGAKEIYMWTPHEVFFNDPKSFTDLFKEILLNGIMTNNESVKCIQRIRGKCNSIQELEFFYLGGQSQPPYKLDEFKQNNDSQLVSAMSRLRKNFMEDIENIIIREFGDYQVQLDRLLDVQQDKDKSSDKDRDKDYTLDREWLEKKKYLYEGRQQSWINLRVNDRNIYDQGRLKRFFAYVRLMIQDTILDLSQKTFKNYDQYVRSFIPSKVIINGPDDVVNEFENGLILSQKNPDSFHDPRAVKPLFMIELLKAINEDNFCYSTIIRNFQNTILIIFNKALEDLAKIPDLEPKIMKEIYKGTRAEMYYKVPQKSQVMNDPFGNQDPYFFDENIWVNKLFDSLSEHLEKSFVSLDEYLKCYQVYREILMMRPEEYIKTVDNEEKPKETEAIRDEILELQRKEEKIKLQIPEQIQVGCFKVNCKEISQLLSGKYQQLYKLLIDVIVKRAKQSTIQLYDEIQKVKLKLNEPPVDIEKLTEIKQYMLNLPLELEKMREDIDKSCELYDLLEPFKVRFQPEDIQRRWQVFGGPKEIMELVDIRSQALEKEKGMFLDKMKQEQDFFLEQVKSSQITISTFYSYQNMDDHDSVAQRVRGINDQLQKFQENARQFNSRELLFELEQTDYSTIQTMVKEFKPYSDLWLTTNQWFKNIEHWRNDEFEKLDADYCEKFMEEAYKTTALVNKYFNDKDIQPVLKIGQNVRSFLEEFRPKVPLMVALRKQGMKERHWEQVSAKLGQEVKPSPGFTFTKAIDMGLMKIVEDCMEIGERAYKEYQIETMLNSMMAQWEQINFDVAGYKNISFIIRGFDDIGNTLDEHIVNTQAMQFSPFKKPFENVLNDWNSTLKKVSDILEVWAKVQVNWMYLQPIFDSPDISKQLPLESKKFKQVDQNWKQIMFNTKNVLNVLKVCSTEGLLEKLTDGYNNLEQIQKELNNYLERKRERFARFYFLSNDDLLEILSQTKEPTAVQPHLRKVFENVNQIEFDGSKKIHAMFSAEGEKINFVRYVDPNSKNVEDWMNDVEDQMKQSVRAALLNSITVYVDVPRIKWVTQHPGQCVLNGSQVHWTKEVEQAIRNKQVKEYLEQQQIQLNNLVDLVRTKLTKMQMVTINALIVIDVHAKDVVELLFRENVDDVSAFEWISQLRYYWESDNCFVKCIQTNFPYGYEYLGNTLRLVITPLTDKCYMTLMGALKLNLGGAPAGPAGTGKTESTKDLAKALAKQCVVFNCSDQMDYIMVGKFFKGLASAGAWACFDEFNRINIEVLSVIAQQLLILFGEKAKGSDRVEFEGSDIRLQPTFSVFITMNPGYAGRTELPDNLKALFRPVAMMVPDYALIGEIMLYSFGFKKGRELAKKMVYTFKLSSEQLSSQDHYDYGMRAVRSVINAAGLLKAADPDQDEDRLLLRALMDVNVPKFLKDDLPLFSNIIKDLFPGIEKPEVDIGELLIQIQEACKNMNLQCTESFLVKINQLYDTIQVRHGLMLVGPTGGGKTSNYNVLAKSLTALQNSLYYKVHTHILNPKSITMGQLYGQFNEQTREWNDGILAYTVREVCRDQSSERHWIMFDGPVDAIWIESMNTVLDDNKKLCLNSGQILTLTPYMTMMFEVEDLAVASPATVSRCGMVYMEPVSLGLQPLITSWLNTLPPHCKDRPKIVQQLSMLFEQYMESTLEFMRKNLKEVVGTFNNNLTQSLCRLLNCYLHQYKDTEIKKVPKEDIDNLEQQIEPIFTFCLTWSLCCTVDQEGREKMNVYVREQFSKSKANLPKEGSIFDYLFNERTKQWTHWDEQFKSYEVDPKLSYSEILIPTTDSTRNMHLMKTLMSNSYHCLFPGPTGTGKSVNAMNLLIQRMGEDYQYMSLSFSAQTSANQTQDTIDSKLTKRRKGYYGPPPPKKCIIFVDDLNMPKKEEYGAQPPIELLRQYMDHKGWYNRKELFFMNLQDIILLSAMGPPGGGRSAITNRLMRHYNIIAYTELDQSTIKQIFGTLVSSFLRKFSEDIRNQINNLVDTVLQVYETVKRELLPTPKKSHYTFNLRDINKVFQGICSASSKYCTDSKAIIQLWYHENMRVFHDRLINTEDREYLKQILQDLFTKFGQEKETILSLDRIIFADFQQGRDVEPRHYYLVNDLKKLSNQMYEFQQEYNADPSFAGLGGKKSMKLVLFLDACEHICRISRVLRQPQGNALLLGVGGSGRQSLAKMATFISYYRLFQIEVIKTYNMRAWREDVKKVLMMAGVENKGVSFLFVDTQIINEQMLEDMNSILNSGDVTNLYQDKDMDEIITSCKGECLKRNMQPTPNNIFAQYLARVKNNIHLILAMSPLSDKFQTRLRMFPSLVNCCTIDWFTEWPEEALIGVGRGQLSEYATEFGFSESLESVVEMCKIMHKSVESVSVQYQQQLRRYNYVTPTSFLELITMFKQVNNEKKNELKFQINRLKSGLDKLIAANEAVSEMQIQLKDMQPKLEEAAIETEKVMAKLEVDKKDADETQKIVSVEEAEAQIETKKANEIKREAEESVAEANRILETTLIEVQKLKKEHLVEVKSLPNPPRAAIITLGGCVILLQDFIKEQGGEIQMMKDETGMKKVEDYFNTAKKYLLNDTKQLLDQLLNYNRENINQAYIRKLEQKIVGDPDFKLDRANTCSLAIKYMYSWCQAMYDFNKIFLQTQPLRDKLNEAQRIVDQKQALLKVKKDQLDAVNQKIRSLQELFDEKVKLKEDLSKKIQECEIKLVRAQKLTSGLSDEKTRWTSDVEKLQLQDPLIPGNALISAAMLAYSGPFVSSYRQGLENKWRKHLIELEIKHTENISMVQFLGVPVKIQSWNIAGLPKDDTSIENGIIIDKSRRYPLMIDPQNQANKFIKNMGKEHAEGIEVLKVNDPNLMRTLELAVQFGKWVLIENVGKDLDPSFDPILLQQIVKSGSSLTITLGEKTLSFNDKFKFFLTTTIPNPHYPPETFVKVTIINFAITPSGLEDQMLALIVALENPQLEANKVQIVRKNAEDKKQLLLIEDDILKSLSEGANDINEVLMDETLINKLQNSKKFAAEINQRVADSKITEEQIDQAREGYRPVAFRASQLFFCIVDLSGIDPMYQYSLQWFMNLFSMGVENAPAAKEHEVRLKNLNDYFTFSLYENVCRSLFEKHKLLFSFMLTYKILSAAHKMNEGEWRYLLQGATGDVQLPPNPTEWISENTWPETYRNINGMQDLTNFEGILSDFMSNSDKFKTIFDSPNPQDIEFPEPWNERLDSFSRIILLKAIRSDKVIPAIQKWIVEKMEEKFIIPPTFDLSKCYKDSTPNTPLIFVLSPGSDPIADLMKFAEEMNMTKRIDSISLGQGQGPKAEKLVKDALGRGGWALLMNCHLATSWMNDLEKLNEEMQDQGTKDFRLWLTSMPSKTFPTIVLQNGVKMTLEPPKGLRNNMLRTYTQLDDKTLNDCKKPEEFKKLLFGFSLFHAIIQERRKFGAIGWNIPYEFTNEDLMVCRRQLKSLLDDYVLIPFKVINYLGAEINYGGRVTDDKDVRLIKTILKLYIAQEALKEGYQFLVATYYQPPVGERQNYIDYIEKLPLNPEPEAFGLHSNAEITNAQNETRILLETLQSIQPRTQQGAGKCREDVIEELAIFVESKTPDLFDIDEIGIRYPTDYQESMNTVLVQELIRYNRLLAVMKTTLSNVKKALKGLIVMSEEMEKLSNSLYDNQVPQLWADKGFLSLKPLASWTQDLLDRIQFLRTWVDKGTPKVFWISGFFFPQAFITGMVQNYARKHVIAIDKLQYEYIVLDTLTHNAVTEKPEDGVYIYGIYLEGTKWDYKRHLISQPKVKELYSDLPLMHLLPYDPSTIEQQPKDPKEKKIYKYQCPLYKVVSRAGTLSTTGHSTNFVMPLELPSREDEDVWIRAGAAAFLSLRY